MTNAIVYARFSPRPNASDCLSIDVQLEHCRDYCRAKELTVVGVYQDEAISGKTMKGRAGFLQALEHACSLKADGALVVYSLSRAARSLEDALKVAKSLEEAGADFICLKEGFDTSTPTGRLFFVIMAALAEFQREEAAERTREFMLSMQAAGRRMSWLLPYGWMHDAATPASESECKNGAQPVGIVKNQEEQGIIAVMRQMREEGCSPRQIAEKLTAQGKLFRGRRWHLRTIDRILKRKNGTS